jgi:hypothetical protein
LSARPWCGSGCTADPGVRHCAVSFVVVFKMCNVARLVQHHGHPLFAKCTLTSDHNNPRKGDRHLGWRAHELVSNACTCACGQRGDLLTSRGQPSNAEARPTSNPKAHKHAQENFETLGAENFETKR